MSNQRHLRNYLLDRDYQLRHALLLVGLSATLTLALGAVVRHYMGLAARLVEVRALDPTDTLAPILLQQMRQQDHRVLLTFAAFALVLLAILFVYSIVFTHRVAGPLHKIAGYMGHIREGRLGHVYELRRGDQLRPFFECFRQMHESLAERARAEVADLERVEELLAGERSAEAVALLRAVRERKQAELS
jgi:methyl-accepting chemotaxis protein